MLCVPFSSLFNLSICRRRQAGHQHPADSAVSAGSATAGGSSVHQQGWPSGSAIAQLNAAPQR
jgi:hypothetical protein